MAKPYPRCATENPVITAIVGRCHVSLSNRAVIRYLISRLRRRYDTWRQMSRPIRREFMKQAINAHQKNRALYDFVMRGR